METASASNALAALGHETRLAIFRLLVQAGPGGLPAGTIAEQLALAPSGLSFHLKELTAAGLLVRQPDGRNVVYRAGYGAMNELIAYLAENCCEGGACELEVGEKHHQGYGIVHGGVHAGVIETLASEDWTILSDADNHASLIAGCRASKSCAGPLPFTTTGSRISGCTNMIPIPISPPRWRSRPSG